MVLHTPENPGAVDARVAVTFAIAGVVLRFEEPVLFFYRGPFLSQVVPSVGLTTGFGAITIGVGNVGAIILDGMPLVVIGGARASVSRVDLSHNLVSITAATPPGTAGPAVVTVTLFRSGRAAPLVYTRNPHLHPTPSPAPYTLYTLNPRLHPTPSRLHPTPSTLNLNSTP